MKISARLASATAVAVGLLLAIPTIAQNTPKTSTELVCPVTGQPCPNAGNCPNPACPMANATQANGKTGSATAARARGPMRGAGYGYGRRMRGQGRGPGYGWRLGQGQNPNCPFVK